MRLCAILSIAILALLAAGPAVFFAQDTEGAVPGGMYTTLTRFWDNSTSIQKDFMKNGSDASCGIVLPAAALMKMATVQIAGNVLEKTDAFLDNTTADFQSGDLENMSLRNGTLLLKPLLKQTTYNVGSSPLGIATGDINHDGHTDIVVANSGNGTVGVLLQNRTASRMDAQQTYLAGQYPEAVAVGDLNCDGLLDVAAACSGSGTLEVLLQKRDGTLSSSASYLSGNGTRSLAIADLNRDGRQDVVTVNSVDSTLSLFFQNRSGALYRVDVFSTGPNPSAVAAGDIDLDGRDELVVACRDSSTISVFDQNASAGLNQTAIYNVGTGPVGVAIGDLNRDGRNDVVVAEQSSGSVGVLNQTPAGLLAPRAEHRTTGAAVAVAIGDLDIDGRADIAAATAGGNISVFRQRGDGTFPGCDDYRAGNAPAALVITDLNSDGKNDIAVANSGDGTIGILPLRALPPGTLAQMASYNVGSTPIGLATGDLNADGLDDILVGNAAGTSVGVLLQAQNGVFGPHVAYSFGAPLGVAVRDMNLDGRDDMIIADQTPSDPNYIRIGYQTQSGDFSQTPVKYRVNIPLGLVYIVASGDLNSDGWPDIAVSSVNNNVPPYTEPNNVSILIQNASTGIFDYQFNLYCPAPRGVAIGDVNSDGKNDLAVAATNTSELWVFLQDANGTLFGPPARYATDASPHGVRIGDLNCDGRNDVVTADWTPNNVNIFLQNPAGTLNPRTSYPASNTPLDLAVDVDVGDFDTDGLNDLAVSHYTGSATVSVLNQTRQGTFSSFVTFASGQAPAYLASGDLNGDGKTDIGVANRNGNTVGVFAQQIAPALNGSFTSQPKLLPYEVFEATAFWNCSTTGANQTPYVWLSNDRGITWLKATRGEPVAFPVAGDSLSYRVRLTSAALNLTPSFDNITVQYRMRSYPWNPSLDIGSTGTPIWNWTGPFGLSSHPALIDFTARLNATLETAVPDNDGNIRLPFLVRCRSLGTILIFNLSVQYDLAPSVPLLDAPGMEEYVLTQTPSFSIHALDKDTARLVFWIQISQDNFSTVKRNYNQRYSPEGWDKEYYLPGEVATFQLPQSDRLSTDGLYQWRAYVWDDTLWSRSSGVSWFKLDTKPPAAKVIPLQPYMNRTDFSVSWNGSDPDPGSGLAPDATYDIQYKDSVSSRWTDWFVGTNATSAEFSGTQGKTYYFQARSRDLAGNEGHYMMGGGDARTTVDTSPPAGVVSDDGINTLDNTRLHAVFQFNDAESGVLHYQYWIGTKTGDAGNDVVGPTAAENKDVVVTGLFLKNGTKYFFTVRVQNGAGLWSPPISSDGITVRLKVPQAAAAYPNGPQKGNEIPLRLSGTDPNGVGIEDGDLEYKVAGFQNRSALSWSDWKEMGDADWGDARPSTEPLVFLGVPGMVYRFRYRIRDIAGTYSDYSESANVTRINRPPVAQILPMPNITAGRAVGFFANGSFDPDGDRLNISWDFGDGKTDFGKTVSHRFAAAGRYTVNLYVDDSLENVSVQLSVTVRPAPTAGKADSLFAPVAITSIAVAAGAAYAVIATRRRKRTARPGRGRFETVPYVIPGSETRAPPPPPPTASEVEAQIAVAREAIQEIERLGVETSRATKMLGLASSFLADDNLLMASQYSKKAAKLAKDQKQRLESEVDEETARRFVTDTQKMLEMDESAGLNIKEAKKLFGHSISFLAEGNYVTGMQYSKKVRRILEELRQRQETVPATKEAVETGLASLEASIAELRRRGEDTGEADMIVQLARTFAQEEDYQPARQHILRTKAIIAGLREKGKAFTAQQWKERSMTLKERAEMLKDDGMRTSEPLKMLKLSESFALQGNLEVASQYVRKAEKLLNDIEDRARTQVLRKDAPMIGPSRCPRCGEPTEPDWVVCAYCNTRLKAEPPSTADGTMPAASTTPAGEIRIARPVADDGQGSPEGTVREVKKVVTVIRPGKRI